MKSGKDSRGFPVHLEKLCREGVTPDHLTLSLAPAQMSLGLWGSYILAFLCFRLITC